MNMHVLMHAVYSFGAFGLPSGSLVDVERNNLACTYLPFEGPGDLTSLQELMRRVDYGLPVTIAVFPANGGEDTRRYSLWFEPRDIASGQVGALMVTVFGALEVRAKDLLLLRVFGATS